MYNNTKICDFSRKAFFVAVPGWSSLLVDGEGGGYVLFFVCFYLRPCPPTSGKSDSIPGCRLSVTGPFMVTVVLQSHV